MIRLATTGALVLSSIALAACGSNSNSQSTATTSTGPAVAAVNPCAVVTAHDAVAALGTTAPPSVKTSVSCTYADGADGVQVRVVPATVANRRALAQLVSHPGPGARVVRVSRIPLYVAPIAPIGTKPTSQAQVSAVRNGTFMTVVLTMPGLVRTELLARTLALGRAAVDRL